MTEQLKCLAIDARHFDNQELLERRVRAASPDIAGSLSTTLRYLYFEDGPINYIEDGPINLPRDRLNAALAHLDAAETVVVRWLQVRTNGGLRVEYVQEALKEARRARYRCSVCGYADVRALNLDHVEGRVVGTRFACLCANCHAIKSRKNDWLGYKRTGQDTQEG